MRIRWRGVARVAAIVVVGLVALRLLPGLLRAPEPPPLGADVGLPRARPVAREKVRAIVKREAPRKAHASRKKARGKARVVPDEPASTASIGTRSKRRRPLRRPIRTQRKATVQPSPAAAESTSPAVPEYVAPPPLEPAPEPLPEPAPKSPTMPGDGSQEFAPH